MRKWCADHHHDVYDLYADRGISGKSMANRPELGRLMRDAHDKKFDIIVFWALSRFTRSVSDLYNTMQILSDNNIEMVSYTESFDTSTPMGRAMIGIVGVFAQLERELTGERVRAAMAARAAQGKRMCNEVLGYDLKGKDDLVINDTEVDYVRFCFEQYLIYKNLSEVAELCRKKGYKGKRGKEPTAYSVFKIITRPIYCGYNTYAGEIYRGNHTPIIRVSKFNKVQHILRQQGKKTGRYRGAPLKNLPPID